MYVFKHFFIKTISLFLFLLISILFSLLCLAELSFGKDKFNFSGSQIINSWYNTKNDFSKNVTNQRKIVFVGGSNILFGINTKLIQDKLHIPVLNYGSHAGLGNYIFYNAKKVLNKNDIVVLVLEYNYFADSILVNDVLSLYVANYDKNYYSSLSLKDKINLIFYVLPHFSDYNKPKQFYKNVYSILNENGDVCSFRTSNNKSFRKPVELGFKYSQNDDLLDFVDYCKKNNISVYAAAPNIYHSNFSSKKEKKFFNEILLFYNQNDIPFWGTVEDGFFSDFADIYDTDYHLTTKSSIRRSEFFVEKLKNLI